MTAKWNDLDKDTQDSSTWVTYLEGNQAIAKNKANGFNVRAQDTPNMTVRVEAGQIESAGTITDVAAQNSSTITAPAGNPRIDLVSINSSGTLTVTAGSEAASPSIPTLPQGNRALAYITLQTSTTSIANTMITDYRTPIFFDSEGFEFLEDISGFGAQVDADFSAYQSDYSVFKIVIDALDVQTNSVAIRSRLRTAGGSFRTGASDYVWLGKAYGSTEVLHSTSTETNIPITTPSVTAGNDPGDTQSLIIYIFSSTTATYRTHITSLFTTLGDTANARADVNGGVVTSEINDAIRLYASSGNLLTINAKLLGLRK